MVQSGAQLTTVLGSVENLDEEMAAEEDEEEHFDEDDPLYGLENRL
jgi:hypothetical protein